MSKTMNIEGWEFAYTEEMLEYLRDSPASNAALVLYTESGPNGPYAGNWDVRSTLPSGGASYVTVLPRERVDLRGDLCDLADELNANGRSWPPIEPTEGVVSRVGVVGRL